MSLGGIELLDLGQFMSMDEMPVLVDVRGMFDPEGAEMGGFITGDCEDH